MLGQSTNEGRKLAVTKYKRKRESKEIGIIIDGKYHITLVNDANSFVKKK
jgi:hypothetical protein